VRAPEALLDDAHLHDRGFWKQVEHPELGAASSIRRGGDLQRLALADLQTGAVDRPSTIRRSFVTIWGYLAASFLFVAENR